MRLRLFLLIPALILFGCRPDNTSSANIHIGIELANDAPAVSEETTIRVSLSDSAGNPINDATVNIRGDMSHAGMTPVLGESTAGTNGVYEIPFTFSMAGDWILTVDVTLADGSTASQTFNINGIGSSTTGSESTAVSAAYFTVTNNSTADIRLLSVSAEGVGMSSIHQTIVENNVARMEEVQDGLEIAAGQTVELAPGAHHVMLMNLANPLIDGESLILNLAFDNGLSIAVEAPISLVEPDEGGSAEAQNISISGAWLRSTSGQ
jgi:copper(I)-binding protein